MYICTSVHTKNVLKFGCQFYCSFQFENVWIITRFFGREVSFSRFCQTSFHASIISCSPLKVPNIAVEYPIAAECSFVTLPTCSSPSTDNKAKSAYIFKSFIPPVHKTFIWKLVSQRKTFGDF